MSTTFEDELQKQERIQHQFDTLMRKVLIRTASNYRKEFGRKSRKEVTFSDMSEKQLEELYTMDDYDTSMEQCTVMGIDVIVRDWLLAEALNALSDMKREIILSTYWLDLTDEEIGKQLNVVRSTIYRNRKSGLEELQNYMEENKDGTEKESS